MERDSLKKEIGDSLDSLTHQYKSSLEFTEELRVYIKEYLEKDMTEKQAELKTKLEVEIKAINEQFEMKIQKFTDENKDLHQVIHQLRTETEQQDD